MVEVVKIQNIEIDEEIDIRAEFLNEFENLSISLKVGK